MYPKDYKGEDHDNYHNPYRPEQKKENPSSQVVSVPVTRSQQPDYSDDELDWDELFAWVIDK